MSAHSDISIAFVKHLKTLPGLPALVAYENGRTKEPVNGQAYYAEYFLPSKTSGLFLGFDDPDEYKGIYQVSIFTPSNSGRPALTFSADDVIAHFKKGTVLSNGSLSFCIEETASITPIEDEGPWSMVAVRIPYRIFV